MNSEYLKNFKEDSHRLCKLFYDNRVGWECGDGWNEVIFNFSLKCEELNNRYYKKYRYRIIAEQIKEKYGTLRLYCSVIKDPNILFMMLYRMFNFLYEFMNNKIKYNMTYVEDSPTYKKHDISVFNTDKKRFESGFIGCSNVKTYDWCNKYIKISHMDVYGKRHRVATKHKFLYWLMNVFYKWSSFFRYRNDIFKESRKSEIIGKYMDMMLEKYTREAELDAEDTCEICGNKMNNGLDKKCETVGWISYICDRCAEKSDKEYIIDDKIYKNGEYIRDVKDRFR